MNHRWQVLLTLIVGVDDICGTAFPMAGCTESRERCLFGVIGGDNLCEEGLVCCLYSTRRK